MYPQLTPKQIALFWSHVDRTGGPDACWPWLLSQIHNGYGQWGVAWEGKTVGLRAHRVAYFLEHGVWPEPFCCHTCDVRHCCNPAHLYTCTPVQNTADMMERTGHNRPRARFTDDEVREFRRRHAEGESLTSIAESAGHDVSAMSKLLRGLHYRHLP